MIDETTDKVILPKAKEFVTKSREEEENLKKEMEREESKRNKLKKL